MSIHILVMTHERSTALQSAARVLREIVLGGQSAGAQPLAANDLTF